MTVQLAPNQIFSKNFLAEMAHKSLSPSEMRSFSWRPYQLDELNILGPDRDRDLSRLEWSSQEFLELLEAGTERNDGPGFTELMRTQKVAFIVVPGFTHETLKNLTLHEEMSRRDSPCEVLMLRPSPNGLATTETHHARGNGFKLVYLKYPRSNAGSESIVEPMHRMLKASVSLRRWVDEGYKLVFLGYSYGCPLTLELLAGMQSGQLEDDFVLANTIGFYAMCGAIGGSYLADDLMSDEPDFFSMKKLVQSAKRYPLVGKIVGLPTDQFKEDMLHGMNSLTRFVRQQKMADYAARLPKHVKYLSIAAVMPMDDYQMKLRGFNFDDFTMFKQARISEPVSVYNDGQVVLSDNLIPRPGHLPPDNHHHLGSVRTHHWGVAYRTFNLGQNPFPRRAFYKALIRTGFELGLGA